MADTGMWVEIVISIHAPVKGATLNVKCTNRNISRISIHAPVKGATALLFMTVIFRI